jgi:hypothetical protein
MFSTILIVALCIAGAYFVFWTPLLRALFRENATARNQYFTFNAAELGWLDEARLRELTAQLEGEGFRHVMDLCAQRSRTEGAPSAAAPQQTHSAFTTSTHAPPIPAPDQSPANLATLPPQDVKAFGRIFVHPSHGFAANILAARAETQNAGHTTVAMQPLQIAIISLFGRDENYWSYATTNHKPDPFSEWHQNPQGLYIRRVGTSARELLQIHLQTMAKLRSKIPAPEMPFRSAADYMKYEELAAVKLRENYTRKTVWEATRQLVTFKFRRHDEYWGTLGQRPV